jgi:hypothetical protein
LFVLKFPSPRFLPRMIVFEFGRQPFCFRIVNHSDLPQPILFRCGNESSGSSGFVFRIRIPGSAKIFAEMVSLLQALAGACEGTLLGGLRQSAVASAKEGIALTQHACLVLKMGEQRRLCRSPTFSFRTFSPRIRNIRFSRGSGAHRRIKDPVCDAIRQFWWRDD